jgi:hypothetical protein
MERFQKIVALFFVLCFIAVIVGCRHDNGSINTQNSTASVRSYFPVLNVPDQPELEALTADELGAFKALSPVLQTKLVRNSDKLMLYGSQLRATLDSYNETAKANNKTSDAALGIGQK